MKSVIFIAPPASGKGTQSTYLENLGYEHISTGDMLRNEINSGSKLGAEIKELINNGGLVSDEIVIELITNKLASLDNKPFILDGFPRTMNQAISLNDLFTKLNISNYLVIYLDIDESSALKRSLGRMTCECGKSYNIYYDNLKPQIEGICDNCHKELVKRNDDNEESFKNRFTTFMNSTLPIKDFYKSKNVLVEIDASKDSTMISKEIEELIK